MMITDLNSPTNEKLEKYLVLVAVTPTCSLGHENKKNAEEQLKVYLIGGRKASPPLCLA